MLRHCFLAGEGRVWQRVAFLVIWAVQRVFVWGWPILVQSVVLFWLVARVW